MFLQYQSAEYRSMIINEDLLKDTNLQHRTSAVNLQHLRYATAAVDHGSFRRAAETLCIRQSTLSRCVRQLENSVGMTIFERSTGGGRATEAGGNFLRLAQSILEQLDLLLTTAQRTDRGARRRRGQAGSADKAHQASQAGVQAGDRKVNICQNGNRQFVRMKSS